MRERTMPLEPTQIRKWLTAIAPAPKAVYIHESSEVDVMRTLLSRNLMSAPQWFEASDTDGNGLLDRQEFYDACLGERGLSWL